jgi:4'-phosphopantetheinyl transferase
VNTGGIDLWRFPLDGGSEAANAALAVLCRDERTQFRQFENVSLAAAFAIRRAARRIILASYLGIEPAEVATRDTASGKPELSGASPDLYFNASHSRECGILAVTRRFPLGADVEHLRPIDTLTLAARILSPTERLEFEIMAQSDRDPCMFRVWTAKEALDQPAPNAGGGGLAASRTRRADEYSWPLAGDFTGAVAGPHYQPCRTRCGNGY